MIVLYFFGAITMQIYKSSPIGQLYFLKVLFKKFTLGDGCQKNCHQQRTGIAAGGIFYNVQPGTAAQLKI
jgi:hypothetical protein